MKQIFALFSFSALTLYELQSAQIDLANKRHRDKEITSEELIVKLLSAEATLKEAVRHLLYEPSKSPEGKIAQRAMSELKMLRTSINSMQSEILSTNNRSNPSKKFEKRMKEDKMMIDENITVRQQKDNDLTENILECNNNKSKTKKRRNNKKKNR